MGMISADDALQLVKISKTSQLAKYDTFLLVYVCPTTHLSVPGTWFLSLSVRPMDRPSLILLGAILYTSATNFTKSLLLVMIGNIWQILLK